MRNSLAGNSINCFGISDIGISRSNNEDVWTCLPEIGFFALADGMGGRKAGEIAAQKTIHDLSEIVKTLTQVDVMELIIELRHAIEQVNSDIFKLSCQTLQFRGMGSTLCCLLWLEETIIYAHCGDSRVYRFRNDKLTCLTQDHSLLSKWLNSNKKNAENESKFPYKHVITRAIGSSSKANPEMAVASHQKGDIFFLCSDGLSDVLSLKEMEEILCQKNSLEWAANTFIEKAKFKGGSDNMTIVMVKSTN